MPTGRSPTGTCQRPADIRLALDHRRRRSCSPPCRHSSRSGRSRTEASGWRTSPEGRRRTTWPDPVHCLLSLRVARSPAPPLARRSSSSRESAITLAAVCCGAGGRTGPVVADVTRRCRRCRRRSSEDQPLTVWWNRDAPFRSSPLVKEGQRCRTTRAQHRHATSRDCLRSPRVMRVPIRAAARGEALRTRHHRGLRRRRGASPECSVSAGLHPSPGTVHPRRHQAGGGDGENIGTPRAIVQMKKGDQRSPKFHFPRSGHNSCRAIP